MVCFYRNNRRMCNDHCVTTHVYGQLIRRQKILCSKNESAKRFVEGCSVVIVLPTWRTCSKAYLTHSTLLVICCHIVKWVSYLLLSIIRTSCTIWYENRWLFLHGWLCWKKNIECFTRLMITLHGATSLYTKKEFSSSTQLTIIGPIGQNHRYGRHNVITLVGLD